MATIGHSTLQLLPTERAPDSDPESTLLCSFVDIITGLIVCGDVLLQKSPDCVYF